MKRTFFILFLALAAAGLVCAQSDLQPVAIVRLTKSEPITVKQLRTEVEKLERSGGRTMTAAERRQVLDVMINEKLALQAAERDKVTISDAEVNQQLQQFRASMAQSMGRQPTDAEFEVAIRNEAGTDLAGFKEQVRKQLLIQKYLLSQKRSVFENIAATTDAEIQHTYELTKSQFVRPDTVRISMILVPAGTTAAEKTKAKELADKLVRDIGPSAAKFDEAVIRAQAPGSGYQGGDGGYIPRNMQAQQLLGAEFVNIAFTLKQGEVSKLIEGPRGYQIIKVTETYEQKNLDLNDVVQLGTRVTVREYIGNSLMQERQQRAIDTASQELITELRKNNSFQILDTNLNW